MKTFTALECVTDFPDDQIEDGSRSSSQVVGLWPVRFPDPDRYSAVIVKMLRRSHYRSPRTPPITL